MNRTANMEGTVKLSNRQSRYLASIRRGGGKVKTYVVDPQGIASWNRDREPGMMFVRWTDAAGTSLKCEVPR